MWTMGVTAVIAWAALHAYTGAVFATTATLALLAFSLYYFARKPLNFTK